MQMTLRLTEHGADEMRTVADSDSLDCGWQSPTRKTYTGQQLYDLASDVEECGVECTATSFAFTSVRYCCLCLPRLGE